MTIKPSHPSTTPSTLYAHSYAYLQDQLDLHSVRRPEEMNHQRHQYPFLSNSHDLYTTKDLERRHSLYQLSSDQRHHSFALPHQLSFQHPFNHQHLTTHVPQMVPQHFAQDFSFGLGYDHMPHGLMEHDDSNEPTTRPRLTKEQVDFFEREFAANSKPPSTYKRALALQTNIDYNRISVRTEL